MKDLNLEDIAEEHQNSLTVQDYKKKLMIEGVQIAEVKRLVSEDGTFEELVRIAGDGFLEVFPDIKVKQINRSKLLPKSVKAWHIHYKQEDVWYVPPEDHMILGLWDIRKNSPTVGLSMKVVLGNGASKLVYIPRGVAHGVINVANTTGEIFYFINNQFNILDADERRLPWDSLGTDFWEIERG